MKNYISTPSKNEINTISPRGGCDAPDVGFLPSSGAEHLPCLFSNISTENVLNSTQHRKSANALSWNVQYFAQRFGLENLGFLTLTFKDHVLDVKEAQRRLNSLLTHIIKKRYKDYVGVLERQKSGRIHYHLLVNVGFDIRTGVSFQELTEKNYTSASKGLRDEWLFWRRTAPKYRFGRTELLPVKSSSEAIGRYVGKYIGKHMEARDHRDKNARLVRYSRGARVCSTRFMFLSDGSAEWRAKMAVFMQMFSDATGLPPTFEAIRQFHGPRWAYKFRDYIASLPALET